MVLVINPFKENKMEHFASYQDSRTVLEELGFIPLSESSEETIFDSRGTDQFGSVVQVYLYQCHNSYWCLDIDGGYLAPIVWNGPRAEYDKSDTKADLIKWLDENHPGWQ